MENFRAQWSSSTDNTDSLIGNRCIQEKVINHVQAETEKSVHDIVHRVIMALSWRAMKPTYGSASITHYIPTDDNVVYYGQTTLATYLNRVQCSVQPEGEVSPTKEGNLVQDYYMARLVTSWHGMVWHDNL